MSVLAAYDAAMDEPMQFMYEAMPWTAEFSFEQLVHTIICVYVIIFYVHIYICAYRYVCIYIYMYKHVLGCLLVVLWDFNFNSLDFYSLYIILLG